MIVGGIAGLILSALSRVKASQIYLVLAVTFPDAAAAIGLYFVIVMIEDGRFGATRRSPA